MNRIPTCFSGLRIRLVLLVMLAIVPSLGMIVYTDIEQRKLVAADAREHAMHLAQLVSRDQQRYVDGTRNFLITLSHLPPVVSFDADACNKLFAALLRRHPQFENITAVSLDGNVFASALPLKTPVNLSDRKYFRQAIEGRSWAMSDYQIGRITGSACVLSAYPVLNASGEPKAVVVAALSLTWLNKLTSELHLPEGTTVTIVDREGKILVRNRDPDRWLGRPEGKSLLISTILREGEGTAEIPGLDGVRRVYGFTRLGGESEGAYVSVGIPERAAFAAVERIFVRNLILLALVALMAIAAAWFMGEALIIRGIKGLIETTKRLAGGELNARTGLSHREGEVGQLSEAFDQMADSLENHIADSKRLADENAVMARIGQIVSSTLRIEDVYQAFAQEAKKVIPFDRISVNVINPDDSTVTIAYLAEDRRLDRRQGDVVPLPGTVTELTVRLRSPLMIRGEEMNQFVNTCPAFLFSYEAGTRSFISIPLITGDKVIGALLFLSTQPEVYQNEDVRIAQRVANQIAGAVANAQLYAERNRAEQALEESEKRFKDLFDNAPVGYHELDSNGRIRQINRTELNMFGYTAEEMLGQPTWRFLVESETSQQTLSSKISGLIQAQNGIERTCIRKDGTTFPACIDEALMTNPQGEVVGVLATIRDMTELKRAQEEKRGLEDQLRQAQKMEAVGQLAGGIAHDFNNLLGVILGYSDSIESQLQPVHPIHAEAVEIKNAAKRAASLTRQLLAFSRKQILQPDIVDLNRLIGNMEKMLCRVIGEDVSLNTNLAKNLGPVKVDSGQIEQVIMNIVVNARDAMSSGGKLTIETADIDLGEPDAVGFGLKRGAHSVITICDTGVGMTREVQSRVFEPFFTTKGIDKGTGLGLSTAYGIVKQSGGSISVHSEPAKGTTFKIFLPRAEEDHRERQPSNAARETLTGSETILLVEDEDVLRKFAKLSLLKNGYRVLEGSNGEEALRIVEQHKHTRIHLLITDVVMPGMNGHELAASLESLHTGMKFLYMSGHTEEAVVHRGIMEKKMNFIQKPFTGGQLSEKVRQVLDS